MLCVTENVSGIYVKQCWISAGKITLQNALFYSFIHSGDLYSASSRDYYSEALPAQSRPKKKDFREM